YGAPNQPASPCFATDAQTIVLVLQGTSLTLYDARVGAQYSGDPATGLTTGLIRGFVTEEDAKVTIVPLQDLAGGSRSLASLLRGGDGNCKDPAPAKGDRDTDPNGRSGWYFYLSFSAAKTV